MSLARQRTESQFHPRQVVCIDTHLTHQICPSEVLCISQVKIEDEGAALRKIDDIEAALTSELNSVAVDTFQIVLTGLYTRLSVILNWEEAM